MGWVNLAARAGPLCLAFFALNCSASTPPPVEAFARVPHIRNLALSPDGKRLVAVMNADEQSSVAVLDREKSLTWQPVFGFETEHSRLSWCKWANRTRILCATEAAYESNRNLHKATRIFALDADGSDQKSLLSNISAARFQDRVLDWTPYDPETVLIELDDNNNGLP